MTLTKARLLLAASGCALLAPHAYSQEETASVQDTIIVTVPGPERSADELIGNVTAISRDEIVEHLAASLGDTLDHEPGVSTTFFGAGASRPVLRGLGAERVQVLTNGIGVIDASAASPDHQVASDGIDAERIPHITTPFTGHSRNPYTSERGWGLGLSISKALIDLHGGDLEIQSEVGRGTTVILRLRLTPSIEDGGTDE